MPVTAVALVPMEICPVAPGNAQRYVDQITGYVLWGVGMLFVIEGGEDVGVGVCEVGQVLHRWVSRAPLFSEASWWRPPRYSGTREMRINSR